MTAQPRFRRIPSQAMTKADYDTVMRHATRPLGDQGIGSTTSAKRQTDAAASQAATDTFEAGDIDRTELLARRVAELKERHARCGTNDGYRAHRDRNELPCVPCRRAHRQENAA